MASITSVEMNYLVFRYLQESGFIHTAFSLGYEAALNKCTIDGNMVPPGALITFVQKGLQYLEMEANFSNSDTEVDEDFSLLQPLDLITKDVYELRKIIKEKKKFSQKDSEKDKEIDMCHADEEEVAGDKPERDREGEKAKDKTEEYKDQVKHEDIIYKEIITDKDEKTVIKQKEKVDSAGPEPMDIVITAVSSSHVVSNSDVMILEGHSSEVCACAWNPTGSLLASGSGDSTARIWSIADSRSNQQNGPLKALVLKHVKGKTNEKSKDVTTLDWNKVHSLQQDPMMGKPEFGT